MSRENKKGHAWEPDVHLKLRAEASPITLRDHQLAAHDRMTALFLNETKKAALVVVPTGGGKTLRRRTGS